MTRHRLEVADVFRSNGAAYLDTYGTSTSSEQLQVLRTLARCRTAALGGHKLRCDHCGHEEISYNSCRNRHCPKCQASARKKWLDARANDLLETVYFHVVFTLPNEVGPIALQNKRLVYGMLFRAVSETLLTIAKDPKHLGAQIGFLAVLHTWGEKLDAHPHMHCVVPGGGLSPDNKRWIPSRKNFFVHVKFLSRLFRRKFLAYFKKAFKTGKLTLEGKLKHLREPKNLETKLRSMKKRDWVVYAERPFGGAAQVLKYLARYTNRVAISNQRLLSLEDGNVTFHWKDYASGRERRRMTLDAVEFIRRFLLHVLPKGFQRIRQYGFLANCVRQKRLKLCRELLDRAEKSTDSNCETATDTASEPACEESSPSCPACKKGKMIVIAEIPPDRELAARILYAQLFDTS